jgi:hypothetical protein
LACWACCFSGLPGAARRRHRALQLDGDARLLLTGSSDHTVRLWDLGQQRCVQTLAGVHACSVWCAVPDASWHFVYSGGSDGRVYVTDLAHKRSTLLFQESHGVLKLCRDDARAGGEGVWAATMGTDVSRWRTEVDEDHQYYLHHHNHSASRRQSVNVAAGLASGLGGLSVGGGNTGGGSGGLRGSLEADLASASPGAGAARAQAPVQRAGQGVGGGGRGGRVGACGRG